MSRGDTILPYFLSAVVGTSNGEGQSANGSATLSKSCVFSHSVVSEIPVKNSLESPVSISMNALFFLGGM